MELQMLLDTSQANDRYDTLVSKVAHVMLGTDDEVTLLSHHTGAYLVYCV